MCIRDRNIVSNSAIAAQDLVDHFLTVNRIFQRKAQVFVVKRCGIAMHHEHVLTTALGAPQHHARGFAQQIGDFRINQVGKLLSLIHI